MPHLEIGDKVRWTVVRNENAPIVGVIKAKVPTDSVSERLALYDVQFSFGSVTIEDTQLELVGKTADATARR